MLKDVPEQCVNGDPWYLSGQLQIGLCFITLHKALVPQEPGHGSWHFPLIHARDGVQSVLWIHSGRQLGGFPMNVSMQAQTAWLFTSLQTLLGPHGERSHGLLVGSETKKFNVNALQK